MYRFDVEELRDAASPPFVDSRVVAFQDVDAAGIVFYPRVLEYFHDAYVAFLDAHGCPLSKALDEGVWAAPIRHAEAHFFKPMRFGDPVDVAIVRAHVDGSAVTFGFRITRGEKVLAVGQSTHVWVDRKTFQRIDLPEVLGRAFASVAGA